MCKTRFGSQGVILEGSRRSSSGPHNDNDNQYIFINLLFVLVAPTNFLCISNENKFLNATTIVSGFCQYECISPFFTDKILAVKN